MTLPEPTKGKLFMLTVGQKLPSFNLKAVPAGEAKSPIEAFVDITDQTYEVKWLVLFAWTQDFTYVCLTDIALISALKYEIETRDALHQGYYLHCNKPLL